VLSIAAYWRMTPAERRALSRQINSDMKIGRNDPCPCGSGRKFKKCCGA
jgi:SEC-C motif domain protein